MSENMNLDEAEVQFRPLTEGLGFHPYSDEPIVGERMDLRGPSMGTGAMRAGPAQFVSTAVPSPQVEQFTVFAQSAKEQLNRQVQLAGEYYFFRRTMAFVTDLFIGGIIFIAALSGLISSHFLRPDFFLDLGVLWVTVGVFIGFAWALLLTQEVLFKTSFGKTIFRLGFTGGRFGIFVRGLLFLPSFFLFGFGLVWAFFDRPKCLHDRISGVQPIDFQ